MQEDIKDNARRLENGEGLEAILYRSRHRACNVTHWKFHDIRTEKQADFVIFREKSLIWSRRCQEALRVKADHCARSTRKGRPLSS